VAVRTILKATSFMRAVSIIPVSLARAVRQFDALLFGSLTHFRSVV
jgi:hypothetical protein